MFSIYRSQEAVTPLCEAWEIAPAAVREAILQASQQVDQQLFQNPQEQGESRDGTSRILFQAPLGVIFEVDEEKQLVRILRTWTYRTGAGVQDCW